MIFASGLFRSRRLSFITALFFIISSHAYWPASVNAEGQRGESGRVIFPFVSLKNPERINEILSARKLKTRLPANTPMGLAFGSIYLELASDNASEGKVRKVTKALGLRFQQGDELFQLIYESKINADILLADAGHEDLALFEKELSEYNLQGFILRNGQLDSAVLSLTAIAVLACRFPALKVEIVSRGMGIAPAAFRSQIGVAQRFLESLHTMRIPKVLSFAETDNFVLLESQGALPVKRPAPKAEKKTEEIKAVPPPEKVAPPQPVPAAATVDQPDKGEAEKRAFEILNGELQAMLQDFDQAWQGMDKNNADIIQIFFEAEKVKYETWQKKREPLKDSRSLTASEPRSLMNLMAGKMEARLSEVRVEIERLSRAKEAEGTLRQEADKKFQAVQEKIAAGKEADRKTLEALLVEIKAAAVQLEGSAEFLSGGRKGLDEVAQAVKGLETKLSEMKAAEEKEAVEKESLAKEKLEAERKRLEAEKAAEKARQKQDLETIQERRAMLAQELTRLQENLRAVDEDMKKAEEEKNRQQAAALEISRAEAELEKETGRLNLAWKRMDKNNLEAVTRLAADMENVFNRFKTSQPGLNQSDAVVVADARKKFESSLRDLEQKVQEANAAKDRILKIRAEEENRRLEAEGRLREIKEKIDGWKGGDSKTLEVMVGELKAGLIYLEGNARRLAGGKKELKKVRENLKKIEKELSGMKAREAKEGEEWERSEEWVKRLNEEVNGLMERVKAGGSVEEKEKLAGELEMEEGKVRGDAARLVNSTGSERIEGNRKVMNEIAGKVGIAKLELRAEAGKEKVMRGEEKAAEGLVEEMRRGIEEWKVKAERVKGGDADGMRGVLSGMAEARKRWEESLFGLKNESGSERVEALKREAGDVSAGLDAAGEGLSQALEARQAYETNLASERSKLTAEMFQYKNEVLQRSSALSGASTTDIAKWIQDMNAKLMDFTERRKTLAEAGPITEIDGIMGAIMVEKSKYLAIHKEKTALETWEKSAAELLEAMNQRGSQADEWLKSATVDQADAMKEFYDGLAAALNDFSSKIEALTANSPASTAGRLKGFADQLSRLKAKREQINSQWQIFYQQILTKREEAKQLVAEASRVYGALAPELDKGLRDMKSPESAKAVNPAVLFAQAEEGGKLARQWEKDIQGLADFKDATVSGIREQLSKLAENLKKKSDSALQTLEEYKKQAEEMKLKSAREKEEVKARTVFDQFNREYFRIQELRASLNMKDPDEIEKFVKDMRNIGKNVTEEMPKITNTENSPITAALQEQLSSLLKEIQNSDQELTLVASSLRDSRNRQLEEQHLAKQLYIKVEDRLAEIESLVSTLDTRGIGDLERFYTIISSQRVIYVEEMKKLTNTSDSVVVSFLLEKLQQMLDKMTEYENRVAKSREAAQQSASGVSAASSVSR